MRQQKRPRALRGLRWIAGLLVEGYVCVERGVFAGVADEDYEFAGIDGPLVGGFVPVAEGAGVEVEGDVAGFAGGEADFLESLEFALGADGFGGWIGDVELGDFCSGYRAGVGDVEADGDRGDPEAAVAGA